MSNLVITGLSRCYYAVMEDEGSETYKNVKEFAGIREVSIAPKEESASIYAENRQWDTDVALGDIEASFDFTDVPDDVYIDVFGKKKSTNGGIIENANDVRPYVAIMFEKTLTSGVTEYVTLFKGKFTLPEDKTKTKEGKTEYQTRSVSATFLPLKSGIWKHYVRSNSDGFNSAEWSNKWGKEVIIPVEKTEVSGG